MAERLNWENLKNTKKIQTQGYQRIDDLYEINTSVQIDTKQLRTFNDPETVQRRSIKNNNLAKKDLLHFATNSIIAEKWLSDMAPKSMTQDVNQLVKAAGGILKWAKAQHGFQEILNKKKKRRHSRARKHLLRFVINSLIAGDWISDTLPKSVDQDLMNELNASSGPNEWAQAQPRFKEFFEKAKGC